MPENQETYTVPPAYSWADIEKRKFKTLEFEGVWLDLIGTPEVSGSWIIWGYQETGKPAFAPISQIYGRIPESFYNTLEEGMKLSFKQALEDNNIQSVGNRFCFHKEKLPQLLARLRQKRSPNIIIIDSLQHFRITQAEYYNLLEEFPTKLFIFISHAGKPAKGELADEIRYNSDVKIRVDKFIATPVENTRYGGNKPYTIWEEGARNANIKIT